MALCLQGLDLPTVGGDVPIFISTHHPLIKLANAIPWVEISTWVSFDLLSGIERGYWHIGRKLKVRIHLGAYFLRHMFNMTYRQTERELMDNAAYQIFCGKDLTNGWHIPDHSRMFEFQKRLSPRTHAQLANAITQLAVKYGFAQSQWMDIDSTIQEAKIRRISEISLMERLSVYAYRLQNQLQNYVPRYLIPQLLVPLDLSKIRCLAKYYFIYGKGEEQRKAWTLEKMKEEMLPAILALVTFVRLLKGKALVIPSNLARYLKLLDLNFLKLLENTNYYIQNHIGQKHKLLSLHMQEIDIFAKGRALRMKVKYGRQWQLGRIGGNFLIIGESDGARCGDHQSVASMISLHWGLFGIDTLESFGTDRGYYSEENWDLLSSLQEMRLEAGKGFNFHLPRSGVKDCQLSEQDLMLHNRRSGVEALIGHAKAKGQLRRSRATTDLGMKNSGYNSILGFNLRQFTRYLMRQK